MHLFHRPLLLCLWALCVLPAFVACEKVDLPQDDVSSAKPGGTTPATPPSPPQGAGDGSLESPYTVAQVQSGGATLQGSYAWVAGYVVGHTTSSIHNAVFTAEGAVRSNVLLADSPDEREAARCLPVELKREEPRLGMSLAYNPDSLGRYLCVNGTIDLYFRVWGLRDADNYAWLGAGPDGTDGEPEPPAGEPDEGEEPGPQPEEPDPPVEPDPDTAGKDTLDLRPGGEVIDGGRVPPRRTFPDKIRKR